MNGVGRKFNTKADSVGETEVNIAAYAAGKTGFRAVPKETEVLVVIGNCVDGSAVGGDSVEGSNHCTAHVLSFVVTEGNVCSQTGEDTEVNSALGVVTAEEVREVEGSIDGRSYIVPLPIVGGVIELGTAFTLPSIEGQACAYDLVELITDTKLGVGREEVAKANLTQRLLGTTLYLQVPVWIENVLSVCFLSGGCHTAHCN